MRLARESSLQSKHKIRCRSIYLKDVFEICNHKSLINDVLTDYMEVLIVADKMQQQVDVDTEQKKPVAPQNSMKKFVEPSTMQDFKKQLEIAIVVP